MKYYLSYWVLFLGVFLFSLPAMAGWKITQITDNDFPDMNPVLTANNIAWLADPDSSSFDVFFNDGSNNIRVTTTDNDEQNLWAGDKYFAWNNRDSLGSQDNIFAHDGNTDTQVTTIGTNTSPITSGDYIVYQRSDVANIYLDDLSSTSEASKIQLIAPDGAQDESNPFIYGDRVVFQSSDGDDEIYLYSISTGGDPVKITDNALADYDPVVNDNYIAWIRHDGSDREVMVYDIAMSSETQVTNDTDECYEVSLQDGYLAYLVGPDPNTVDLVLYDIVQKTKTVIDTDVFYSPDPTYSMGNRFLVYAKEDGFDSEIFVYDMMEKTTEQLTDNDEYDISPQTRGSRIVWVWEDNSSGDPKKMGQVKAKAKAEGEIMEARLPGEGGYYPINAADGTTFTIYLPKK